MTTAETAPPNRATAQAPTAPPPPMRLRELVFGAALSAAVRAAARLGVPDALGDTPQSAEALAAKVATEPKPLCRMLRALACYGVFTERPDGTFAHTDMSRLLREDDPNSLRAIALWCTEPWTWAAWPKLDEAVRSGRNVVEGLFGKEFFTYLNEDAPESADVFNQAMTRSSEQSAREVAALLDLSGSASVADLGGGQGHVVACLLDKYPQMHGSLLDLPGWWRTRCRGCARAATWPAARRSCRATSARRSRSRPTSTSSRTSWSGTTRARPGCCTTSSRRAGPAPG